MQILRSNKNYISPETNYCIYSDKYKLNIQWWYNNLNHSHSVVTFSICIYYFTIKPFLEDYIIYFIKVPTTQAGRNIIIARHALVIQLGSFKFHGNIKLHCTHNIIYPLKVKQEIPVFKERFQYHRMLNLRYAIFCKIDLVQQLKSVLKKISKFFWLHHWWEK